MADMSCPQCRQENPPGAKFCSGCGGRLEAVCPACGHPNLPGGRFCNECGKPVAAPSAAVPAPVSPQSYTPRYLAEKILTSRHALEGERKQVTVLFADIKGSLELLSDRDPEEARKLLDPVLERMMEAVHRYEGTVNQVMGDGIMALFGAPLAHEDHAVRACYAALAMQQAIRRYTAEIRRDHGIEVQVRVGLNSGEVVVRAIGSDLRMDYSAVGQTTHLAARMEQLATPGSTRLTGETLRLAEGFVQVVPIGPVPVKGLPGPVDVFELAGPSATRTRLQAAAARGLTRFVGRGQELVHLRQALDKAARGQGQVVAVVGEPGVGKSRLLWEFIHSHRTQDWLVLESSSVSYGKASAYLPVIDLCKSYFRIEARDDARSMREKVTGKLLTLDESFRAMVPAFLSLLEVPSDDAAWDALDPGQRRRRTVDGLRRMLLRESQIQPLCLVFEDLHWVDAETQGLLDALVEGLPTARILLLVNYRPEYSHGWGGKTYYSQLRLDPLPPESAEELLRSLLGEDDDLEPLKRLLVKRTEGVPFFLEESVRTLVETGALAGERGGYRLGRPLDTIQVPATVQAILAARIDRLSPEDKTLLQTAAVIGKDVPFAILEAISETSEETLRHGLGRLLASEFLYETALFPELEYTFKHALTQEVAYGGLLQERRRDLHARIVRAFESLYPGRAGEQTSWLTLHAFRGEVWDRAVAYLRGSDLPSLDGYLSGFTGGDNPGAAWWMGDHEHAVRAAQRELGRVPRRSAGTLPLGRHEPAARSGPPLARPVLAGHGLPAQEPRLSSATCCTNAVAWPGCPPSSPGSGWRYAWLSGGSSARAWPSARRRSGSPRSGIRASASSSGARASATYAWPKGISIAPSPSWSAVCPGRPTSPARGRGRSSPPPWERHTRTPDASPRRCRCSRRSVERAAAMKLKANQSIRLVRLAEAHVSAGRPESAFPLAAQALDLAQEHRERGHEAHALRLLASIEIERETPALDRAEEGTARPSLSPSNSACDRYRRIATSASVACISDGATLRLPRRRSRPPATSTALWT